MGRPPPHHSSSSSSIDSSNHPSITTASSPPPSTASDLSTDLRLGLGISSSTSSLHRSSNLSEASDNWPPIKGLLRTTLERGGRRTTFFVKVYMDAVPIGRKLDLFALHGYPALITTLTRMFNTPIRLPDTDGVAVRSDDDEDHVLTYEDKEGDWMMVGDVPWELFLTTVKRLKISRADNC